MAYSPTPLISGTATSATNLTIDLSSWYNVYSEMEIHIINTIPAVDPDNLSILLSADGTTFDNSANNYIWQYHYGAGQNASTGDTKIRLNDFILGTAPGGNKGIVRIQNMSAATGYPTVQWQLIGVSHDIHPAMSNGSGVRTNAQVTKAIRFFYEGGNIASFTYRIIGIK